MHNKCFKPQFPSDPANEQMNNFELLSTDKDTSE